MNKKNFFHLIATATVGGLLAVASPASAADPVQNTGGVEGKAGPGSIKVTVSFKGDQKKRGPIRVNADPFCQNFYNGKEPLLKETYVFGDNDTLQNVVVFVSKGLEGKKFDVPSDAAVIDQEGCRYSPHVSAIQAGRAVEIRSSDATSHNVKFDSKKNGQFNQSLAPVPGAKMDKKFDSPELGAKFACNVHPWMNAYLCLFDHPYFAVTQQDGTVTISGLEPGEYEISTWHNLKAFKPGESSYKVTVKADGTAEVAASYAPPGK